jgi:hypothetical protein
MACGWILYIFLDILSFFFKNLSSFVSFFYFDSPFFRRGRRREKNEKMLSVVKVKENAWLLFNGGSRQVVSSLESVCGMGGSSARYSSLLSLSLSLDYIYSRSIDDADF